VGVRVNLSPNGRYMVGTVALLVIGFALGSLSGVNLAVEPALAMLGGAATLLLLAARRGPNGS